MPRGKSVLVPEFEEWKGGDQRYSENDDKSFDLYMMIEKCQEVWTTDLLTFEYWPVYAQSPRRQYYKSMSCHDTTKLG